MMSLLSAGLSYLFGSGLKSITLPVVGLGLLVSLYHNFNARRDAVVTKAETNATAQCNSSWRLAISKKNERDAIARAAEAERLHGEERRITEGLNDELQRIRTEAQDLRTRAGSDSKCLSDGVLSILGGDSAVGQRPAR